MRPISMSVLCAGLLLSAGTALAQTVPADQSCGGLLCDMGVFGHKVAPPPAAPVAAPVATPAAEVAPVAADAEVHATRKKRIARAKPKAVVAAKAPRTPATRQAAVAPPVPPATQPAVVAAAPASAPAAPPPSRPAATPDIAAPWAANGLTGLPPRPSAADMFHPIYQ